MPDTLTEVHRLDADAAEALAPQLIALLRDAVDSGASLGFWRPLTVDHAQAYWRTVIAEVDAGERWLLVALREGALLGSVQLALPAKQNATHRAEAQKLMVYRAMQRQGVGQMLMRAVERLAYDDGRTLLILDTSVGSDAERLYPALGYLQAGVIPRYTVESDGKERATTIFFKSLSARPQDDVTSYTTDRTGARLMKLLVRAFCAVALALTLVGLALHLGEGSDEVASGLITLAGKLAVIVALIAVLLGSQRAQWRWVAMLVFFIIVTLFAGPLSEMTNTGATIYIVSPIVTALIALVYTFRMQNDYVPARAWWRPSR